MSRIRPAGSISFPASAGAVSYRGYWKQVPDDGSDTVPPAYTDRYFEVKYPQVDANNNVSVDLGSVSLGPIEGTLRVAFSAFDAAGNESDLSPAVDFPLDAVPPAAPGQPVFTPAS